MDLDQADLSNLQSAWMKPEVREALCKAILVSIQRGAIDLKVSSALTIFSGIDDLVAEEEPENKTKNQQV